MHAFNIVLGVGSMPKSRPKQKLKLSLLPADHGQARLAVVPEWALGCYGLLGERLPAQDHGKTSFPACAGACGCRILALVCGLAAD